MALRGIFFKLQACQIRNFINQLLMPTRPLKNEIMGCEGAFEDILAFFQATPAPSFCALTDMDIDRIQVNLCQKHLFLHQLTHNMTTDCSLN